jgi:hypothetical protein
MGAQAINQPRPQPWQKAVPQTVLRSVQVVAAQLARSTRIKYAHLDALGVVGEHRKVHTAVAGLGAQGLDAAWVHGGGQMGQHGTRNNVARGGRFSSMEWLRP